MPPIDKLETTFGSGGDGNCFCAGRKVTVGHEIAGDFFVIQRAFRNQARATEVPLPALPSPRKEALRESGNEARLYDQPNKCLERGQYGKRVIHRDVTREEPTPVETGHTEHESAEW